MTHIKTKRYRFPVKNNDDGDEMLDFLPDFDIGHN
jgi:hypothetical protein